MGRFKNRVCLMGVVLLVSIMLAGVGCQVDYVDGYNGQDRRDVYDE